MLHTVSFNGKKYFHISVYCGNNHFHILTLKNYIGLESTVIEGMVLEGSMGRPTWKWAQDIQTFWTQKCMKQETWWRTASLFIRQDENDILQRTYYMMITATHISFLFSCVSALTTLPILFSWWTLHERYDN